MKLKQKLLASSLAILLSNNSQAFAAGYSTELYSTSGLANSYAGSAAGIHDVSDMFFNPANLTDVKDGEFVLSASYLKLDINPQGAANSSGAVSGTEVRNAGSNSVVPAFYVAKRLNDQTTFGLAVTSPFGLKTQYDKNWQGKERAVASSITTININPSLAYKIDDQFSIGAGFQAQYYSASLTSQNFVGTYEQGKVKGDDWGYGFNLGAKYKVNDKLKFGIGYRSKVGHSISGSEQVQSYGYSDIQAKTSTPESLTAGVAYKLNQDVELAYDLTWTRWSRLKSLTVNAVQNQNLSTTTNFNWHNSLLHSVGANFTIDDKWLLRTGLAYEKEAITDANREARVPASDKVWTSIGFNYKFTDSFSMDATYMHQFYRKAASRLNNSAPFTDNSLYVHYKTKVDVISLALRKEF
ncbi:MAG: OmpP1/FadL family transporter [Rickettsiales bacterium]|nr:OmpP1/FadL family transporter [Rickettsiales bacterium]